jgi:hypothetical protein
MCIVRNAFYDQELRIVSQKRSWNKELRFGTLSERGLNARITECNMESATNQ